MALVFIEGFDAADSAIKWNGAGINTSTLSTRFGSGRIGTFQNAGATKLLFQELPQVFAGYAFNALSASGLGGGGFIVYGDKGASAHVSVQIAPTGVVLNANAFGAVLATGAGTFSATTWYYVEVWAVLATSGGRCQVRVNGTQYIDFTGNTMNGGTLTTIDAFGLSSWNSFSLIGIDDVYICDNTGTRNNTFLGDVRIQTLVPSGAGSSTQFTPTGSINNWQNTNDLPDSVATFNAATVVGQRDMYGLADVIPSTGAVLGIQENVHTFKTDSGQGNIKPALKSGATLVYDPVISLPSSIMWSGTIRELDPNTSDIWQPVALNALEFGGEVA